jgi:pilus assembly protein CpaB
MNLRVVIALTLAIGLGGLAVLLAWQGLRPVEPAPRRVVLAAQALRPGTTLLAEQLQIVDWTPASGALPQDTYAQADALVGRVLKEGIAKGAPLRGSALRPEGGAGLSDLLSPGMRAVTLRVDQVMGVAGFALPGSRVDVLLTGQADAFKLYGKPPPTGNDPQLTARLAYSKVVLEGVRVLALSQQTSSADGKPLTADSATLEVSPAQAVTLNLARQLGTLALVLRRNEDEPAQANAGQLELGILPTASAPAVRAKSSRGGCVNVYEGGKPLRVC